MKIVHVCNRYYPIIGGLETHVKTISEKMVALGHEVLVYTTDRTGKLPTSERINGVLVNRFKAYAPNEAYYFSYELLRAVKQVKCDVMHGHDLHSFPFLAAAYSGQTKTRIATLHFGGSSSSLRSFLRSPYDRTLMHLALKRVNKIICVSEYELRVYPRILGLPLNKFIHIPNGTDRIFSDFHSKQSSRRLILSVGRLEKSKGFHYLIKSFALLVREREYDDLCLTIVGKGPYQSKLVSLANKLNILGRIRMLENISEEYMTKLYNDCEMFVLLSQNESTAIALLDALAMHKPAISTKRGGLADYVRKGYCIGVDWPPDPATVAFEMAKLLRNLKEHVPVNFKAYSWDDVTLKLLSLYKCVLSEDSD